MMLTHVHIAFTFEINNHFLQCLKAEVMGLSEQTAKSGAKQGGFQ